MHTRLIISVLFGLALITCMGLLRVLRDLIGELA